MRVARTRSVTRLVLAAALAAASIAAHAQFTHPRPMQRAQDQYETMLLQGEFDALDRAADKARSERTLLGDGQPLLTAIYRGAGGCMCSSSLTDELWKLRGKRVEEWVQGKPGSVTARLSHATYPVAYAWFARGSGYGHTVSKEAWALFRERVEVGRKRLEAVDAAVRRDPGWYALMLDIGLAQSWPRDRFDALFEEGATAHPHYLPLYFTAANFHSPSWYGSPVQLRQFIDAAVARTRPSLGDTLHARLNWLISTRSMYADGQADWRLVRSGFERILADHPDPWNLNGFAVMSCAANDWPTLAQLMQRIGGKPVLASWSDSAEYYERCRAKAEQEAAKAAPGGAKK